MNLWPFFLLEVETLTIKWKFLLDKRVFEISERIHQLVGFHMEHQAELVCLIINVCNAKMVPLSMTMWFVIYLNLNRGSRCIQIACKMKRMDTNILTRIMMR